MTYRYVPGRGYTVTDSHGRIVAHSQTPRQLASWRAHEGVSVLSAAMLAAIAAS